MIEKIKPCQLVEYEKSFAESPFKAKIISLYYNSEYLDSEIFIQHCGTDILSFIGKIGNEAVVDVLDSQGQTELFDFLKLLCIKKVLFSSEALKTESSVYGSILYFDVDSVCKSSAIVGSEKLKYLYYVFSSCEDNNFQVPDFSDFYVQLSHMVRHSSTFAYGIENEEFVSACVVGSVTKGSAVLSMLATKKEFQGKGCGSRLLFSVTHSEELLGKRLFLLCNSKDNELFYLKNGFKMFGNFEEIIF